ncbi:Periplasmic AppA protein [Pandoraea iniqua]|uniref:histidine-type phosphatase n=1 Tax=Pandoraea iniqua TaxID=2508288 RepID=UPI001241F97A|nr:histidine-type phosphatase [Pandoraea iniqua]VVE58243.1 Periplasmic AppA protein [Pandoraea iniqua]
MQRHCRNRGGKWAAMAVVIASGLTTALLSPVANAAGAPVAESAAKAWALSGMRLERAVIVMRHGVRAATDTPKMDAASAQPWPAFEVADGQLTPHGYKAVTLLGAWERQTLNRAGLLGKEACAGAADTFVWTSPSARTQATAKAMLDGMFPGCGVPVRHTTNALDTLFHGAEIGLGTPDPKQANAAILQAMGGSPELARKQYEADVAAMVAAVGVPADCAAKRGADTCGLYAKAWGVKDSGKIGLTGPVSVGASMSETIRMQYADGWPLERIAFGHVKGEDDVIRLMGLRSAKYDLVNHTPYLARRGASQLLSQVAIAIESGPGVAKAKPVKGGPPPARLTLFVAHDTNISQVRAMLGFDWKLGAYRENDVVPGGMLMFERFVRQRDGKRFVRVSYVAQSLDQTRNLVPLDEAHPPLRAVYRPKSTGTEWLTLAQFESLTAGVIDREAIAPEAYVGTK